MIYHKLSGRRGQIHRAVTFLDDVTLGATAVLPRIIIEALSSAESWMISLPSFRPSSPTIKKLACMFNLAEPFTIVWIQGLQGNPRLHRLCPNPGRSRCPRLPLRCRIREEPFTING